MHILTQAERKFYDDLKEVSGVLGDWARRMICEWGWSVEDCKLHLRNAAAVAERQ